MKHWVYCCLFLLLFSAQKSFSQTDSCRLRISVLTCGPGEELYSTFGHSAIRVVDSIHYSDIVFNYGTFDFDDPNFYSKFTRGTLRYFLSVENFNEFIAAYQYEQRSVVEQELNLSCAQKVALLNALKTNLAGDNKYYQYDFLFDNCTTRIRDLLNKNVAGYTSDRKLVPEGTTYRNQLYSYLDKGGQPWSKLGIDILLGSKVDAKMDIQQSMFLPDFLEKGIDSSHTNTLPSIVSAKRFLYQAPAKDAPSNRHTPLIAFTIVAIIILAISFSGNSFAKKITLLLDSILIYLTGLTGILLLFMWFGTDHKACVTNYNLLWALPTNIIAGFFIWKRPEWLRKYFKIAAVLQILLVLCWFFLPQQLNIALLPLVILMAVRYWRLASH